MKRELDRVEARELPGGIILTGGGSALPGVLELAEEIFDVNVKMYVPEQMGMRNPIFATSLGLIKYIGEQDEIYEAAKNRLPNRKPSQTQKVIPIQAQQKIENQSNQTPSIEGKNSQPSMAKGYLDKAKQFIQSIFE